MVDKDSIYIYCAKCGTVQDLEELDRADSGQDNSWLLVCFQCQSERLELYEAGNLNQKLS